jgi:hypothetical protein
MKSNLLEQLDMIPPCICRLCARKSNRAMTIKEISDQSGLSVDTVEMISKLPSWEPVSLGYATRFSKGCGVDLLRPRKKLFYLRRAFSERGLETISRGLTVRYVKEQIRIRQRYESKDRAPSGAAGKGMVPS